MRREALLVLPALLLAGCAAKEAEPAAAGLTVTGHYPLEYAEQFTIDECAGGYSLVTIGEERYLVVPEDAPLPTGLEPDLTILQQPIENIYLGGISSKRARRWKTEESPMRGDTAPRIMRRS